MQSFKDKPLFNGTVDVDGEPVRVTNGQAEYQGKQYFVSKDGKYVMDMNMGVIAKIIDGALKPLEKTDVAEMIQLGIIAPPKGQQKAQIDPKGMLGGEV